ncbi:MAG: dephospho-CoA kinase [Candidatus Obscuribacterales bacterium]|nr:dephospho-CoA kinase [Cyanobacteria bacterium HKST-UBA01]MCB9467131.1 dephospho-CoA kinase [Candidatus Obscuribacterales bacterium]
MSLTKKSKKGPFTLGITGTIASGKSSAGKILQELGVPVIDTDHIVHEILAKDPTVIKAVKDRFGEEVLTNEGKIDREKLGKVVFSDHEAKKSLEAIVHPATIMQCRKLIEEKNDNPVVAILVPLLFEARLESEYDEIWTIFTDEAILKERLAKRNGLDSVEIEKRLGAQMSQNEKVMRADHVIDNSDSLENTRNQIKTLLSKISGEA